MERLAKWMGKIKVKIFDDQFAHTTTCCHGTISKYIEWYRDNDNSPVCFITDRSFGLAKFVKCKRKIGWLIEPRGIDPKSYDKSYLNEFDYMLSHDKQFISIDPQKILFYPFGCCWIPETDRAIHPKTKLLSMINSGKAFLEGHRFRNSIYDRYSIFNIVDGYGHYQNPIKDKTCALKDYMFSICMQNTKTNDFFSEIIIDCFMTGTIPIYWGTGNIGNYFNANGIMQFNTQAELDNIILYRLSTKLYESRMDAIKDNYEIAQAFFSPEDYIFEHYPFLFEGL